MKAVAPTTHTSTTRTAAPAKSSLVLVRHPADLGRRDWFKLRLGEPFGFNGFTAGSGWGAGSAWLGGVAVAGCIVIDPHSSRV
jgi:hypothetical protein